MKKILVILILLLAVLVGVWLAFKIERVETKTEAITPERTEKNLPDYELPQDNQPKG